MKNKLWLIALVTVIGFSFAACGTGIAPTITTATLPNGTVGKAYSQTLRATGDNPITWSIDSGTLPAGLSLTETGAISGTPTTAGTSDFTVRATNAAGSDTKSLSITIATASGTGTAPTITTVTLPNGTIGTAYSQTLAATGDTPITWSIDSGILPLGLNLTGNAISGTPTTSGTSDFTVKATNAAGNSTKPLSITIATAGTPDLSGTITISPSTGVIADMELTAIYSGNETVTYQWYKDGAAINGAASAKFTPTEGGSYTVTVNATGYNSKNGTAVTVNAWTAVTDSTIGTDDIYLIAYGNGKFVAVVESGIVYSTDGVTWTAVTDSTSGGVALAYVNNKFVLTGAKRVSTSTDGVTWTTTVADIPFAINAIAYGNNMFVAGGRSGKIATSTDGINWQAVTNSPFNSSYYSDGITSIAYGNNIFIAGGDGAGISTSTDGTTWTKVLQISPVIKSAIVNTIAYCNNKFFAGASDHGGIAYSSDGVTWTAVTDSTFPNTNVGCINAIAYGNNKFVAVGDLGKMAFSMDGMIWKAVTTNAFDYDYFGSTVQGNIYAIAYGNNKFVAAGMKGKMVYLLDN